MLSDTLFEVGTALAEDLQNYQGYYDAELIKQVLAGWIQLEKIRIKLDCGPFLPELSAEESAKLAKSAISSYFKRGEFSQIHLEEVL